MINVAICGRWASLPIFCFAAIRRFPAIASKTAVGIVARIAANVRNCCSNPFKKVNIYSAVRCFSIRECIVRN